MFDGTRPKKLDFTANFPTILFRHRWTRQTFDILFYYQGPSFIKTTWSLTGRGRRPMKSKTSLNFPKKGPGYNSSKNGANFIELTIQVLNWIHLDSYNRVCGHDVGLEDKPYVLYFNPLKCFLPAAPGMDECGGTTRLCVKECPTKSTFIATGLLTSDAVQNEALGIVEYERSSHFQRYELVPTWNIQDGTSIGATT